MTSLSLSVPRTASLLGKTALITGASSGIGLATAKLFAEQGARVINLDIRPPEECDVSDKIQYVKCDQSSWTELLSTLDRYPVIDIAIANGGISELPNYFDDAFDENGTLQEPPQDVFRVNLIGSINFCKIALSRMRKQREGGSIVVVSSATAIMPEHSLPVYGACKAAMLGLVRCLRSVTIQSNVTINAICPAATISNQLPRNLAAPIIAAGLPVSEAEHVAVAILHSVTAHQENAVELYGKDSALEGATRGRWHGRNILTLGDTWTEIEEPLVGSRKQWFGADNEHWTKLQQAATDFRILGPKTT